MTDAARTAEISAWLVARGFAAPGEAHALSEDLLAAMGTPRAERNVADKFRDWETDMIAADLRQTASGLINAFMNIQGDFNLSTGVRNSNWFNAHSVALIGRKRWDRRGAVGTHHYTMVDHYPTAEVAFEKFREDGYRIIAAEITDDAIALPDYQWQDKTVVLYGEEQAGISPEVLAMVDDVVYIPQRGSVRSLNVGTTSGIFTYDYCVKRGILGA